MINKMSVISVPEALSTMSLEKDLLNYLVSKRGEWEIFGKMNSHLYRKRLMEMFTEDALNGEERFMVYFLFAVVKNKNRVMKSLDAMSPEDKGMSWFPKVRGFINQHVTQYVSDVVRSKKFPAVNIPNTNPGLDVLVWALLTHPNKRKLAEVAVRPTFAQLLLDNDMQEFARAGNVMYWDNIIKGSLNPDAIPMNLPVPEFRQEYYESLAGDQYYLVGLDLKEVPPQDVVQGYTVEEVVAYFKSIDPNKELEEDSSAMDEELADWYVQAE